MYLVQFDRRWLWSIAPCFWQASSAFVWCTARGSIRGVIGWLDKGVDILFDSEEFKEIMSNILGSFDL